LSRSRDTNGIDLICVSNPRLESGLSFGYNGRTLQVPVQTIAIIDFSAGPLITTQPASRTLTVGQTATFAVVASGTPAPTYQWQKGTTNISGATSASYTTPAATHADNGSTFRCMVSNSGGTVTSNSATLTVANRPPSITSLASANPSATTTGQSIMFAVAASDGDGDPLSYAWSFGDSLTGSGASVLHAYAMPGTYTAAVTIKDGFGGSITSSVTVTVSVALAINSGGGAGGSFAPDRYFSGGRTYATTSAIDTAAVSNTAPQAVYQSERYGNFTYTVPQLVPGAAYTVRLHFAEIWWNAAGKRLFNVSINGQQVLSNFDVYANAGGKFKALVREFSVAATSSGQIVIVYSTLKDNAKSSGIEVIGAGVAPAAVLAVSANNSIDLGTVKIGKRIKLQLDAPQSGKGVKLRWTAVDKSNLPLGVSASAGFVRGTPKRAGAYIFKLAIQGKSADAMNVYRLTVAP
jgi:hypothetical protein